VEVVTQHRTWVRVKQPLVQILVVVANIQMRSNWTWVSRS